MEPEKLADSDSKEAEGEAFAEESVLTFIFGDGPKVRLMAAFLGFPDRDHNVTDLARLAGVSRNTVYRHIDDLLNVGVVTKTRKLGDSPMYQINKDSEVARLLAEVEWELIEKTGIE